MVSEDFKIYIALAIAAFMQLLHLIDLYLPPNVLNMRVMQELRYNLRMEFAFSNSVTNHVKYFGSGIPFIQQPWQADRPLEHYY